MTTIREKSTAALAEALHHLGIACSPFRGSVVVSPSGASPLDRVVLSCETGYHRPAAEALAASLTLARRLDFATAWRMAKEALPGGYGGPVLYPQRFVGWYATALDERIASSSLAADFSADGPTPTEALVALTAALRDRAR